jgi:hypothetical protein
MKRNFKLIVIASFLGVIILVIINVIFEKDPYGLIESILTAILTGIISGYIANLIYKTDEEKMRLKKIKSQISKYLGSYDVYHLKDLKNPDSCNYKIEIELNEGNGTLTILQMGGNDYDELTANIHIDESSFKFGEGYYIHPKKENNPGGIIKIFLVDDNTIYVDKNFIDLKGEGSFVPESEKWQWKKK